MKVIDAVWEQRNLGVSCYELQVLHNDDIAGLEREYSSLTEKQYMVAKISSQNYRAVQFFQGKGYTFVETAITLEQQLKDINVSPRFQKIIEKCTWAEMDGSDIEYMEREIAKNVFRTDRIYIDPAFTKEQAAQRYVFWIRDLTAAGHCPFKVMYKGEPVGFFVNKEIKPGVYEGQLAAIYDGYEGTGMGFCVQYAGIGLALENKATRYTGHISGNNPGVMRILMSLGFGIKDLEYVFVKHN